MGYGQERLFRQCGWQLRSYDQVIKVIADCYFKFIYIADGMTVAMIAAYFLAKHDIEGVMRTISKHKERSCKVVEQILAIWVMNELLLFCLYYGLICSIFKMALVFKHLNQSHSHLNPILVGFTSRYFDILRIRSSSKFAILIQSNKLHFCQLAYTKIMLYWGNRILLDIFAHQNRQNSQVGSLSQRLCLVQYDINNRNVLAMLTTQVEHIYKRNNEIQLKPSAYFEISSFPLGKSIFKLGKLRSKKRKRQQTYIQHHPTEHYDQSITICAFHYQICSFSVFSIYFMAPLMPMIVLVGYNNSPCVKSMMMCSQPRSKNIIPNTLKDIQEQVIHCFHLIPYRSQPRKVKLVEIIIICLQAKELLSEARLDLFREMILEVTMRKIRFQTVRLHQGIGEAWRRKNIQLMLMLRDMIMSVLEEGERCLQELLGNYFAYEAQGTGRQGRGIIQARKVSSALNYIRMVMNQMLENEDLQSENTEGHSQESTQTLSVRQEVVQVGVQARFDELDQQWIGEQEKSQGQRFHLNGYELTDLMEGQRLTDMVLWDPLGPEMEFLSDLLEQRQEEEIKYELLCNSTAAQILPAIQQANIFAPNNQQ